MFNRQEQTIKLSDFEPHWLLRLQARAMQLPVRPRVPLYFGTQPIGTVESDFLNFAAADFGPEVLQRMWLADGERWCAWETALRL